MANPPPVKDGLAAGQKIGQGKYELVERLSAGGNGVVWLADHLKLGQRVVVKFPLSDGGSEREQLTLESKQLAALSNRHPNIVNILDFDYYREQPFIVVQYLTRGDLKQYCIGSNSNNYEQGKCLHEQGQWIVAIAQAIDYLHANQFLHRDIKPQNLFFDDSFSPYLGDFGLCEDRDAHQSNSDSGRIFGSLPYMAPEILVRNEASNKSDQFAFAVTAFEFLTGSRPYKSKNAVEIEVEMQHPPSPKKYRSDVSREFEQIFAQALSYNPESRFSNCESFAKSLVDQWTFSSRFWHKSVKPQPKLPTAKPTTESTRGTSQETSIESVVENPEKKQLNLNRLLRKKP